MDKNAAVIAATLLFLGAFAPFAIDAGPSTPAPRTFSGGDSPQFDDASDDVLPAPPQETVVRSDECYLDANGNWQCPLRYNQAKQVARQVTRQPAAKQRTVVRSSSRDGLFSRLRSPRAAGERCVLLGSRCR